MKQIILIISILISVMSINTANNKIFNEKEDEEDFRYDLNISVDNIVIDNVYFFSPHFKLNDRRSRRLIWLRNKYVLTPKQYENVLRQIFKVFKKKFPNKSLESVRSQIDLVDSTCSAINNDVKKHLKNRKGLAQMKDKKLREVVKESFLKTKQLEITCSLAFEILHQKCQLKSLFIDPIAIQSSFHKKRSWVELSQEEKPLSRNNFSINFEEKRL